MISSIQFTMVGLREDTSVHQHYSWREGLFCDPNRLSQNTSCFAGD